MTRMKTWIVIVALIALAGGTTGCAWFQKKPTVDVQQLALQKVKKTADVVDAAGKVVASAQQMEITLYQSNVVPRALHLKIQQGFKTTAQEVQKGLTVLRDLTKTPMERQAAITQIAASLKNLTDSFNDLSEEVKVKVKTLIDGALLMVQGALLMT